MQVTKYQRFTITHTPKDGFPEMVTITKSPIKWKSLTGKRFVNEEKCKVFISYNTAQKFIDKVTANAEADLIELGLKEVF